MSSNPKREVNKKNNKRKKSNSDNTITPKRQLNCKEKEKRTSEKSQRIATSKQSEEKDKARDENNESLDYEYTSKNNNALPNIVKSVGITLRNSKTLNNSFDDALKEYMDRTSEFNGKSKYSEREKQQLNSNEKAQDLIDTSEREKITTPNFNLISGDQSATKELERFEMVVDPGDDDLEMEDNEDEIESDLEEEENKVEEIQPQKPKKSVRRKLLQDTEKNKTTPGTSKQRQLQEFERLKKLPDVQQFLKLMNEKPEQKEHQKGRSLSVNRKIENNVTQTTHIGEVRNPIIKSPSDSTIYTPALKQKRFEFLDENDKFQKFRVDEDHIEFDDKISECIDKLRMKDFPDDGEGSVQYEEPRPGSSRQMNQGVANVAAANGRAQEVILEAERKKAAIMAPTGQYIINRVPDVDVCFNDDASNNFCQISCHLDNATLEKIARGGFMDVDKLLPKNKRLRASDEDGSLQIVQKEGRTFLIPASDRESIKINNFAVWEQGFRVYAAVYTRFNPLRAAEIYQYIHSIHLASQSFQWDNVMYYDFYFRKNMDQNPQRSWAKTYMQLWTLSMRDPLPKSQDNKSFNNKKSGDWKDICCWRYNRNQCKKSGKDCKFEHRCSYCGGGNHIYLNCHRRKRHQHSSGNDAEKDKKNGDKK